MSHGGSAQRVWGYETSGNYFDMLGVQPQLGRFFHESDEHGPDSAPLYRAERCAVAHAV